MKKIVLLSLTVLVLLIFLSGCIKKQEVVQKINVNIAGLQGPTSISMIKMFEEKPLLGENIETDYSVAKTPDIMVSRLLSKEIDIAAIPTNLAAKIYNKGVDYKLAAMNTWGVLYIVANNSTIKDWKGLKGQKINSLAKGTNPDIILRYLLNKNGLNPEKDVTIDYTLGQVELAQAVIAGRIKLAVLPEPFVTMVTMQNKDVKIIMDIQKEWEKSSGDNIPFAQTCLVVKGEFANKYPEAADKFLAEYKKSIDWANNNRSEAGKLVEKHGIGIKAKVAETAIPRCNIRFEYAQASKEAVNKFLKVIFDFSPQDIGGKLPDENFYYKK